MLNRKQVPSTFSPIEFEYILPDCRKEILSNGIPLYAYADNIQPVVQLELVFNAGLWYEKQHSIAQATAGLLKSGTSNKTSFEINDIIEQFGAAVKVVAGVDMASITVSCLTKHLPRILPLVLELITDTQFPQSEIDIYVQNAKERLSVQLLKSDFIANRKIDEYVFGLQHPYGKYVEAEHYNQINKEVMSNHLHDCYQSQNCKMFLAGSFTNADIDLIESVFGQNKWNNASEKTMPTFEKTPASEKKYRLTNDEKSVQGSIRLASTFPTKHHEDFYPMIILNTLFGGYFGSRLMSNIREDKGYTYGIHSYMYNHQQDSAYLITTEAGKDVCEATIKEIYSEMDLLKKELVSKEELDLVKNYLLGNILGDLDGSFQIIQRWKNLILNGFTKDRFNQNINLYKSITPEKLQALANKYYVEENFYELVVC